MTKRKGVGVMKNLQTSFCGHVQRSTLMIFTKNVKLTLDYLGLTMFSRNHFQVMHYMSNIQMEGMTRCLFLKCQND